MNAFPERTIGRWPEFRCITTSSALWLAVPEIDLIVVDTDSDFIIDDCAEHFPQVQVLLRPEHLRDGNIAMNDVLLNTLDQVDADVVLQTHSTNPFLKADTVSAALKLFTGARS